MGSVKYDGLYEKDPATCGAAFPAFLQVLTDHSRPLTVLDLGCGQGRDAIPAARSGHAVVAVDVSAVGIQQLTSAASEEGLDIVAEVADICHYEPSGTFDVVVLDRVLHMLPNDESRRQVLARASAATNPGGVVLTADTPSHLPLIAGFFESMAPPWSRQAPRQGLQFFTRPTED